MGKCYICGTDSNTGPYKDKSWLILYDFRKHENINVCPICTAKYKNDLKNASVFKKLPYYLKDKENPDANHGSRRK